MKPVPSAPRFLEIEHDVLSYWDESRAFERLQELTKDLPPFRFVDGPITANNPMGVHHAWGRTLKDVFIRYQVMNGHRCKCQNGFDCQGLWVEVEVEKELGLSGKPEIEAYGIGKFSRKCRQRVNTFADVQTKQSIRLGQWMDWENSYYTHDDHNITSIWHFLQLCQERGWLYRKGLPMPWCQRCGTSLSEHEMAGSYFDTEHLSVFVRLPLLDDPDTRILVWTTTPWTLSANVAAAVNPRLYYAEFTAPDWDHTLIAGEEAAHALKEFGAEKGRTFTGDELIGKRFETIFPDFETQRGIEHRIIPWEAVDAHEGSGIVHIAPGCGLEDYELSEEHDLPRPCPVDENGDFVEGYGFLTGKNARHAPQDIADAIEAQGKLLKTQMYAHSYPYCWRCKDELIFRLVDEWFISCDEIRPQLIEAARQVNWMPDYLGKRMEDWLQNMGDWCISRKRFWGLPLPFYVCRCGHTHVVGSLEELKERAVDPAKVEALPELHRPWVDEVAIACPACGEAVDRVVEVGDCWLDAGIVPYSTLGYFTDRPYWEARFPAEWICEMREQVRLWFYSMLFMGVTVSGRAPYEKVLGYERVVAEDGSMFSKTGYMIRFDEAVERLGADPMRYLYCSQPVTSDLRFGFNLGEIAQRKLADLWNVYVFFTTYARIDEPQIREDLPEDALHVTDRWLRARTAAMRDEVTRAYEGWDTTPVIREIEAYLDDVSNWYVRVNRRRFWRSGHEGDKTAAYSTLYAALKTTILALAPITPFMTESIWGNAVRSIEPDAAESIHHARWPELPAGWRDDALIEQTAVVRRVVTLARSLREQTQIRVRQPLATLYVVCPEEAKPGIAKHEAVIKAELNVKDIQVIDDPAELQMDALALDFRAAGPALRKDVNKVKALLEALDPQTMEQLAAQQAEQDEVTVPGYGQPVPSSIFQREKAARPGLAMTEEAGIAVALNTAIDETLKREGSARDLVHHIQNLRKEAGLEITQRIVLGLEPHNGHLAAAIGEHRDYILAEVLATDYVEGAVDGAAIERELKVAGETAKATLKPA